MDIDAEIIAMVRASAAHEAKHRPHAGFFHSASMALSELNVAEAFAECAVSDDGAPFLSLRSCDEDPPDCEALDRDGRRIALEVTDLVDGNANRDAKKAKGGFHARRWSEASFQEQVQLRLVSKDGKTLLNGPFAEYIVLIACDEAFLDRNTVAAYASNLTLPTFQQINRAYLVLSYDPHMRTYPCFRLV